MLLLTSLEDVLDTAFTRYKQEEFQAANNFVWGFEQMPFHATICEIEGQDSNRRSCGEAEMPYGWLGCWNE
jgi:hypothetical protein